MFSQFKKAMQDAFSFRLLATQQLYMTAVDKEVMWNAYLASFPETERQEYNCNCCKSFIRHYGNLVFIGNGEVASIWDFPCEEPFATVARNLSELVKSFPIVNYFFSTHPGLGTDMNRQATGMGGYGGKVITWQHLYFQLPKGFVTRSTESIDTLMGKARDDKNVFKRSLNEISQESVETVLELIAQNSLYRGAESKGMLEEFLKIRKEYNTVAFPYQDNYCWVNAKKYSGSIARIRNTAIGTLLTSISGGEDLDVAVTAFERIMAPTNYKRPTALITQKMIAEAEKTIENLGYANSLGRRFATVDDLTVNNLLFVNRDLKKATSALSELKETVPVNPKTFGKVEEVSIAHFLLQVLPKANKVEVLFENRHINNLVSLITAQDPKAPTMFKWPNQFSWSYKNSLTDSMKEKVKAAGGQVEGELRVSLEWYNHDDLDLHVIEPGGVHIYFSHKISEHTGGNLDVDMNAGGRMSRQPVENIIYPSQAKMREGRYEVSVNQYNARETIDTGFSVEIECQGQVLNFTYAGAVRGSTVVAVFDYSKTKGITLIHGMPGESKTISKTVWGIDTSKFHKASMIMQSPNYWDGVAMGNPHYFFILDAAHNDEQARGFFNEFLNKELETHKRVFEALGSRSKVAPADKQVTGLGFSVTQHDDIICNVEGTFNRTLKVKF
jgi:hypothetical protein